MSNVSTNGNHAKAIKFVTDEISNLNQKIRVATKKFSNAPSELNKLVELNNRLRTAERLNKVLANNMNFEMTVTNLLPHNGTVMDAFTASTIAIYVAD